MKSLRLRTPCCNRSAGKINESVMTQTINRVCPKCSKRYSLIIRPIYKETHMNGSRPRIVWQPVLYS
jgi:hypothetical protein